MPEYCITTKEVWHSYLYLEADDIDDAVARADQGEGDLQDSEWVDTMGFTSIRDESTKEVTKLLVAPIMEENNPNNIFSKSKKQKEVDKAIKIIGGKYLTSDDVEKVLKILNSIKNI